MTPRTYKQVMPDMFSLSDSCLELDMGPKEWSRFGTDVLKYAQQLTKTKIPSKLEDERHVVLLAGYPGSGRTEFTKEFITESGLEKDSAWHVLGAGVLTHGLGFNVRSIQLLILCGLLQP